MNAWYPGVPPAAGASFRDLFDTSTAAVADHLVVETVAILPTSADPIRPRLRWDGGPIELCWIDCGKTRETNEAWYGALSPHFLPDRTLVVMQDWGSHRDGHPDAQGIKAFTDRPPRRARPAPRAAARRGRHLPLARRALTAARRADEPCWDRTSDPLLKRQLLYRLS